STDVSHMTGLTMRASRNLMTFIREERGLSHKTRLVSIFDFCACFNIPLNVVMVYINSPKFEELPPLTEEQMRAGYEIREGSVNTETYLYNADFDVFASPKELKSRDTDDEADDTA